MKILLGMAIFIAVVFLGLRLAGQTRRAWRRRIDNINYLLQTTATRLGAEWIPLPAAFGTIRWRDGSLPNSEITCKIASNGDGDYWMEVDAFASDRDVSCLATPITQNAFHELKKHTSKLTLDPTRICLRPRGKKVCNWNGETFTWPEDPTVLEDCMKSLKAFLKTTSS